MKIPTKDSAGNPNGYILTVWNALEHPELRPEQVYVTAIAPHSRKGPHLHNRRRGLFFCLSGSVRIRIREKNGMDYLNCVSSPGDDGGVLVEPGQACALYNDSDVEALILNLPSPAFSKDDPDEWPVEDWFDPVWTGRIYD